MADMPTRDEFEALVCSVIDGSHADFAAVMTARDAQAARIAELEEALREIATPYPFKLGCAADGLRQLAIDVLKEDADDSRDDTDDS